MTKIVCVHGIAQQFRPAPVLQQEWFPWLKGGVELAGGSVLQSDVAFAAYGDLFRPAGRLLASNPTSSDSIESDLEREILQEWWNEAARSDPNVMPSGARTLARTPTWVQRALRALTGSRFFAGLSERALVYSLKQVSLYFTDTPIRNETQNRLAASITEETRVVVAHSLGSVVAYEALCANPHWPVRALITLGSPLGTRNIVFDKLRPQPTGRGDNVPRGAWPGATEMWFNFADDGDVVALVKDLRPQFGSQVENWVVHNGSNAHSVQPYLSAKEVGAALLRGLQPKAV